MTGLRHYLVVAVAIAVLAGCSGSGGKRAGGGGYYKDDGPGSNIPANIEAIPNATPRLEAHRPANLRPYVVFGKRYVPISLEAPFRQEGTASWYGRKFHGQKTASGETYDMHAMTAAHPTLPLPSYARVTHARSGKSVIVRINDRGPFHSSRIIDLSYVAAAKLGLIGPGSGQVIVEAITNAEIRNSAWNKEQKAPQAQPIPVAPPMQAHDQSQLITQAPSPKVPDALQALQHTDGPPQHDAFADANTQGQAPPRGTTVMYSSASSASSPSTLDPSRLGDTAGEHIYLQFGAFNARPGADGLVSQINRDIKAVESRSAHVTTSQGVHRVQIGPYPSRTAAVNAALRIQQETGLPATIALR